MTQNDISLRNACILAEDLYWEDFFKKNNDITERKSSDNLDKRIMSLIYGHPEDLRYGETGKVNEKKFSSKRIKIALMVAALLIILLSVSATAFSPLRDFFTKIYKDCTEIVFNITNKNDYLFAEYTYIPEGYKKVEDVRIKSTKSQIIDYKNGRKRIHLTTLKNGHSSTFIDTENAETGNVMVGKYDGYYSITKTSIILVWSTGKYNHCLTADLNGDVITLETLVRIAQSRQPVK